MMNYDEFKNHVEENIKGFLPPEYETADIRISQVIKNNGRELDALQIRKEDENITPSIYLNDIYKDYEAGRDLDDMMQKIADTRVSADRSQLPISIDDITNFDRIKDKIDCRLLNMEKNEEYLKDRPYTQVEDLAVVYSIDLGDNETDGKMSTVITDNLMGQWGISTEELHAVALENLGQSDAKFMSMRDTIVALMFPDMDPNDPTADMMLPPMDPDKMMYVLTSDDKMYGAKQLLNTERMDDIAGQLGGDFVVLPSSVHESIILPNAAGIDRGELEGIVQSVNSEVLEPQDFLSDNVYCYDAQEHELLRADHYQDRQAEKSRMAAVSEKEAAYGLGDAKEAKAEKLREKVSVKEQIAEKKAIIAHNTAEKASPIRNQNKEL